MNSVGSVVSFWRQNHSSVTWRYCWRVDQSRGVECLPLKQLNSPNKGNWSYCTRSPSKPASLPNDTAPAIVSFVCFTHTLRISKLTVTSPHARALNGNQAIQRGGVKSDTLLLWKQVTSQVIKDFDTYRIHYDASCTRLQPAQITVVMEKLYSSDSVVVISQWHASGFYCCG